MGTKYKESATSMKGGMYPPDIFLIQAQGVRERAFFLPTRETRIDLDMSF